MVDDHRSRFLAFASTDARRSPLTASLASTLADDADALSILAVAPAEQQRPVLLLAAIHHVVLSGSSHALARCYPTVSPHPDPVDDAAGRVASFCRAHRDALLDLVGRRTTQTNEVGRSAVLMAALRRRTGALPIALLEVGASAGLNLWADRYRIDYGTGAAYGPADADVVVPCSRRGGWAGVPLVAEPPRIAVRRGIDLTPLDPGSPEDARWLAACVWPDDLARFTRARRALARAAEQERVVVRGDAVDDLADLLAAAPAGTHPVVFHSWVLPYLAPERRRDFVAAMHRLGQRRDLTWLAMEARDEVPELPFPVRPTRTTGATELLEISYRDGRRVVEALAESHPHGRWLDWRPEPVPMPP